MPSSSSASPRTLNPSAAPLLHHHSFNQDASCFAVSSSSATPSPSSSFFVFSTDPVLRSFPDDDTSSGGGGVRHVTMLFRSNILAVVFAGTPNKVMIRDEHQGGSAVIVWSYPRVLCEVSQGSGEMVMVCLGTQNGQIRIENSGSSKRTRFVNAHDSRVVCLGLLTDGRFCATASGKGTLVRVHRSASTDVSSIPLTAVR